MKPLLRYDIEMYKSFSEVFKIDRILLMAITSVENNMLYISIAEDNKTISSCASDAYQNS